MAAVLGPFAPSEQVSSMLASVELRPFTPVERLHAMLQANLTTQEDLDSVVIELYGRILLERVDASELRANWPHVLGRRHILEMLAALGHSITLDDLNDYLGQLKQNDVQAKILHLLGIQNPTVALQNIARVQDLPADQMQKCLELFRNPLKFLPHADDEAPVLWEELERYSGITDKRCLRYTSYDYSVHRLANNANKDRPEFIFGGPELLAKHIGYAKPESISKGMVIPVFRTENGPEVIYYQLDSHVNDSGLHVYLFTPINRPEMPSQLVFRGTNGLASTERDLDTSGVGKAIFDKNAPAIAQMVETYCSGVPNAKVEISGHSLGAADSQRAAALLVDHGIKNPGSAIAGLKQIKVFAYCSPKLDSATVANWDANLQILAGMQTPPRIELNFALHRSDFVTWTGDSNLHGANATFINTNYLLVKSPSGVMSELTHHTKPFFQYGNFDFQTDRRTFILFQDSQYRRTNDQLNQFDERRFVPVQVQDGSETVTWELVLGDQEFNDSLTEAQRAERVEIRQLLEALERTKAEIKPHLIGWAQHSWVVWIASWVAQPVKAVFSLATNLVQRV